MGKSKKVLNVVIIIIMLIINMFLGITSVEANTKNANVSYENFSIGGGGRFYCAKINPKNKDNYVAISDMGGVNYSFDSGKNWKRTEERGIARELYIDKNGIIFTGAYGLYKSIDGGQNIELIYPKKEKVLYSISRAGWSENLMLAEGYNNGYLKAVSATGEWVYFITLDWEGRFNLIRCDYEGNNLLNLYEVKYKAVDPINEFVCKIIPEENGVYFSVSIKDENKIFYYNLENKTTSVVYSANGKIKDLKKIGNNYFVLDDIDNVTEIIYTEDFIKYNKLNDFNKLENKYKYSGYEAEFEWHFKEITGNSFNNIFLSFTSKKNIAWGTLDGIMHFDGNNFSWVWGDVENREKSPDDIGWSFGGIGPIYSVNISPCNENQILVTDIETIVSIEYNPKENIREVHTLHNKTLKNGFYTSTGLNLQATHGTFEDPFNSNNMLVATSDLGLQISRDAGKSFRRMEIKGENNVEKSIYNTCYDIYYDKKTSDLVYGLWSSIRGGTYYS